MSCSSCNKRLFRAWHALTRKKIINEQSLRQSKLERTLGILDLLVMGVGATLGVSIYVMLGQAASAIAGPSILVSLGIDAVAALMSGAFYAELAARMPLVGSAYTFTSVVMGEALGFIVGWNLLFEYMIGTALFARGFTAYIDNVLGRRISIVMTHVFGTIDLWGSRTYPDVVALLICLILTAVIAFGWKPTKVVLFITEAGNSVVIILIVIVGAIFANTSNLNPFMPFGILGTIKGASTCFYAFVGFDVIAMSVEETKNPRKSIPISIIGSIVFSVVAFLSIALIMTSLVPYYELSGDSALLVAFQKRGLGFMAYFIIIGMIFGLVGGLTATLIPLPRLTYALSQDGLLFSVFRKVNERSKVPVIATVVSGTLAGIFALCFDLNNLIKMTSLGTLMAYTSVALCVLLARYSTQDVSISADIPRDIPLEIQATKNSDAVIEEGSDKLSIENQEGNANIIKDHTSAKDTSTHSYKNGMTVKKDDKKPLIETIKQPTEKSERTVKISVFCLIVIIVAFCSLMIHGFKGVFMLRLPHLIFLSLLGLSAFLCLIIIHLQPQNTAELFFKVPLVPWLPALSLLVNIYLLLFLDRGSWIRFGIWLTLGGLIYVGYGVRHSRIGKELAQEDYLTIDD